MTELERVWAEVDEANATLRWQVGRPYLHEEMASHPWEMYAFDPGERPRVGVRNREWKAGGNSEVEVVPEMARCLIEIAAARAPH